MKYLILILSLMIAPSTAPAQNTLPSKVVLKDVGIIGLMSHDIFSWDHRAGRNLENGRLDLSTIFDFDGGRRWESGGDKKNEQNPVVYSVTMGLVNFYKAALAAGRPPNDARQATVLHFHELIKETYLRVRERPLPEIALRELPSNEDQAALRGLHDILPGKIQLLESRWFVNGELELTTFVYAKTMLTDRELAQPVANFDGDYAEEFKNIKIPLTGVVLNLKEIDRKFIESHSGFKQADMLAELARVGRGEISIDRVSFIPYLDKLFAKALCAEGNPWMPGDLPCH